MKPTKYSNINDLLSKLLLKMKSILDKKMIGLYLTGSLARGDFDKKVSDIDLVVVLKSRMDDNEFEQLRKFHQDFAKEHKLWDDRIDVCYISMEDINTTDFASSELVKISSGEPLNRKESSKERLVLWYLTQEESIALFGPDIKTIIEPISKEKFIDSVREHALNWNEYVKETRDSIPSQAYAILTMCRAIYTINNEKQVSKKQAAIWSTKKFPQWSSLIKKALMWRDNIHEDANAEITYPETVEFIDFIRNQIVK